MGETADDKATESLTEEEKTLVNKISARINSLATLASANATSQPIPKDEVESQVLTEEVQETALYEETYVIVSDEIAPDDKTASGNQIAPGNNITPGEQTASGNQITLGDQEIFPDKIISNCTYRGQDSGERRFYAASLPKVAIAELFTQQFELEKRLQITPGIARECMQRGGVIAFLEELGVEGDQTITELIRIAKMQQSGDLEASRLSDEQKAEIERIFKSGHYMTVEQLIRLTLQFSLNSTSALMRSALIEKIGEEEYKRIFHEIYPNFEPTITTENAQHYFEKSVNSGFLSEFVAHMHELGQKYLSGELSPAMRIIFESMLQGNKNEIGFNFFNTQEWAGLKALGYQGAGKTGFYPAVWWVEGLSKAGMPLHMSMSSVLTFLLPSGKEVTIGVLTTSELPIPGWRENDTVTLVTDGKKKSVAIPHPPTEIAPYNTYTAKIKALMTARHLAKVKALVRQYVVPEG